MTPVRMTAGLTQAALDLLPPSWRRHPAVGPIVRRQAAMCHLLMHTRVSHNRPPFGVDSAVLAGCRVPVVEEVAAETPFGRLLQFRKDVRAQSGSVPAAPARPGRAGRSRLEATEEPRVLIVAPLSGHFATLMRDTVRTMLADHDVYVAEWANARDVPLAAGRFGLDEYIEHVMG